MTDEVQMPIMGDHEAVCQLRRRYGPTHLPILALTAAALVLERDKALAAGIADVFVRRIAASGGNAVGVKADLSQPHKSNR